MLKIENIQRLDLGIQGENLARAIEIDCGLWRDLFPNGAINIFHKRPGETAMDVTGAQYDYETGILRWEPTSYDTFYEGAGEAEIRVTEDGAIKKAAQILTIIYPAVVGAEGTIESNWQAFIDEVSRLLSLVVASEHGAQTAQDGAEDAKDAAEESAYDAEAWARGTRGGTTVDTEDETWHNNAKYYAEAAGNEADDAENSAGAASQSATAAAGFARNAAESESQASHWAELAQQGAETSGFAWFDIHDDDGHMYVTVSPKLNGIVQFVINEETGNLMVAVNG